MSRSKYIRARYKGLGTEMVRDLKSMYASVSERNPDGQIRFDYSLDEIADAVGLENKRAVGEVLAQLRDDGDDIVYRLATKRARHPRLNPDEGHNAGHHGRDSAQWLSHAVDMSIRARLPIFEKPEPWAHNTDLQTLRGQLEHKVAEAERAVKDAQQRYCVVNNELDATILVIKMLADGPGAM